MVGWQKSYPALHDASSFSSLLCTNSRFWTCYNVHMLFSSPDPSCPVFGYSFHVGVQYSFTMMSSIICCLLCPLPLFPSFLPSIIGCSSPSCRSTWPIHFCFHGWIFVIMILSSWIVSSTYWFVTFCIQLIFKIFLHIHISKGSMFFGWFCKAVHFSTLYNATPHHGFPNYLSELQVNFACP